MIHAVSAHFRYPFPQPRREVVRLIDVNAANADVVSQLNALRERPDAVVVSGDIVNCGRPEEYQVARQILGSLNYPLYLIPGNHDDKAHFLEHLHPLCPQLGNDPQNMRYAVDDFATRLLFIDSSHAGTSKGWLTDETISWLEAQLFEGGDKPGNDLYAPPAAAAGQCADGPDRLRKRPPSAGAGGAFSVADAHLLRPQPQPDHDPVSPGADLHHSRTVHQVPYCHEDTRPYYDLSPASCLMHRQVGEQWVSYQHSLAHYAGPWLYDENISCPTEER
ncbi:3',5'-cyclic-nucleotide phosphodiesterase [Klebsiella pneumoniae]|uniref:3',5'-cyclic-nucleotide phosphodiesterase n=1 Tax=Klebsiella pneumoniae TaxID=573 RepID=A0A2X3CYL0_KLEPN|nr:3',5'-cyclic-nucleotide phosphodiesterase [Klebsiella pneumoniae]